LYELADFADRVTVDHDFQQQILVGPGSRRSNDHN